MKAILFLGLVAILGSSCSGPNVAYYYRVDPRRGEDLIGEKIERFVVESSKKPQKQDPLEVLQSSKIFTGVDFEVQDGTKLHGWTNEASTFTLPSDPTLESGPEKPTFITCRMVTVSIGSSIFSVSRVAVCYTLIRMRVEGTEIVPSGRIESGIVIVDGGISVGDFARGKYFTIADLFWDKYDTLRPTSIQMAISEQGPITPATPGS